MKNQESILEIFGIKILTIRIINTGAKNIYLFSIPFLSIRKSNNITKINLLILHRLHIKIKNNYALWSKKRTIDNIIKRNRKKRKDIIKRFKKGEKIKICLIVQRPGIWSFDDLYNIFNKNSQFEFFAFIAPEKSYTRLIQEKYMTEIENELKSRNIVYYKGYDYNRHQFIDLKTEYNPDIIINTDFCKFHFHEKYYIDNFQDKINCLNEYGFSVMQDEMTCNFELNNLVDLYFRPTQIHLDMAKKYMKNKAINVKVTGSPKLDKRFEADFKPVDIWKLQDRPKKRIIWAPHRSDRYPKNMYQYNGFYILYDFMLKLAQKYKDEVQFVFRPHPVLKSDLYHKRWSIKQTEEYYKKWDELDNTQLFEGNFIDLFATSDAMITDSCSFLAEYTSFNKPIFHTVTPTSRTKLNEFGEELYKFFYKPSGVKNGDLEKAVEDYIVNIVIKNNDYKKEQRTQFVQQHFGKINGKTASENIYDEIIKFLEKGEV